MTSLSALVDRVADRAPESEAFCSPAGRLTYAEMAEATSRLANLLADEGVRRGDRVGIFMPRCLESAIAVYGILKCGGAFVPMDPLTPEDGLRRLIHDCDLRVIVTTRQQARALAETARGESPLQCVVGLDEPLDGSCRTRPWDDLPQYSDAAPDVAIEPDDLAYIMYSSGSTGRPKGIQHTHHSGSSYARLSVATYDVRPGDRIGNHSPLHFDMSTFGYFSGPMAGATTLLVPEAYTKMAASLSQLIDSERLTIWYSVPLALIQLLSRGVLEERDLSSLRWVLFGGEPFPPKHLRELMRRWPQARFSNIYGPAEVNQCTYYHVPPLPDADDELAPIPIGEIWAETEGLILDEDDRILEGTEVGELVVHSPTMMRGYWRRPDLNARAFFRSDRDGVSRTYYRTGDLVRRDAEGRLLFLGRKDRQLKVRGYRVELDDIEHLLAGHPVVEEAAAYPVRLGDEIDHIEASVTAVAGAPIDVDDLQTLLSRQLSWYAVPKRIDTVESFPRTTSGKIDRRRLQLTAEAEGDAAS